jgi:pimeloyl-ACP methyl ester carboxylesterase
MTVMRPVDASRAPDRAHDHGSATPPGSRRPDRPAALSAALGVAAVAVALLVGRDGSAGWRAARVVAVAATTVGVWWLLHRASRLGRGLAASTTGLIATAVGVGIALPNVTKVGFTTIALAGLTCLGAGLVLLVGGTVITLRAVRPWWRIPVVVGLLAASYAVLFIVGVSVAATNVPRTAVGHETPGSHGLAYEDVRFSTADRVELSGWYLPTRNGAAVVLMHGAGSTRSAVLGHAIVLADHGFGVLLYDARGHGRSHGRAMDFGWYGDLDVAAAVDFVTSQTGVDPGRIAALGLSMGGEEALGAAATDARIRAVVAEGATGRVVEDRDWLSDVHGLRGWVQEQLDRAMYATTDLLTAARAPMALDEAAARTSPRPVLLITAGAVPDERRAAEHIRAGTPATVQVWTAPGAGHTSALAEHPSDWEARVVSFLDDGLGVPLEP